MVRKKRTSFVGKTRSNATRRKSGSSFRYLKIPEGIEMFVPEADKKYLFDIIPYEVTDKNHPDKDEGTETAMAGTDWYKRPFEVHKNVGANNEKVVCPRSFGLPCPICEERDALRKSDGDEKLIKELNPSTRNLYAIVPIGSKDHQEKVYLFDFSDYLFQEQFEEQLQDDHRFDTFPDIEDGCSINVRFGEDNFGGVKFAKPTRFDFVDREEIYEDEILDDVPNLDDCFVVLSYEELKAKFLAVPIEEEDDDEQPQEEEKPTRSKRRGRGTNENKTKKRQRGTRRSRSEEKEEKEEPEQGGNGDCPAGYVFGEDTDEYDDCNDCKVWPECYKEAQNR